MKEDVIKHSKKGVNKCLVNFQVVSELLVFQVH